MTESKEDRVPEERLQCSVLTILEKDLIISTRGLSVHEIFTRLENPTKRNAPTKKDVERALKALQVDGEIIQLQGSRKWKVIDRMDLVEQSFDERYTALANMVFKLEKQDTEIYQRCAHKDTLISLESRVIRLEQQMQDVVKLLRVQLGHDKPKPPLGASDVDLGPELGQEEERKLCSRVLNQLSFWTMTATHLARDLAVEKSAVNRVLYKSGLFEMVDKKEQPPRWRVVRDTAEQWEKRQETSVALQGMRSDGVSIVVNPQTGLVNYPIPSSSITSKAEEEDEVRSVGTEPETKDAKSKESLWKTSTHEIAFNLSDEKGSQVLEPIKMTADQHRQSIYLEPQGVIGGQGTGSGRSTPKPKTEFVDLTRVKEVELYRKLFAFADPYLDPVSSVQNYSQRKRVPVPTYVATPLDGGRWRADVRDFKVFDPMTAKARGVTDVTVQAWGEGATKQIAKSECARNLILKVLQHWE